MRRGALLSLVLAACGGGPGDAARYARALAEAATWEEAREACEGIADPRTRGDCLVGAMERLDVLDEAACRGVDDALWRDECLFLLAERRARAGRTAEAVSTCHRTRFARNCGWHLLRSAAEAAAGAPAAEAERRLAPFLDLDALPDAAAWFWTIWFRARVARGAQVGEGDCDGLGAPDPCRAGFERLAWQALDDRARVDLDGLCAAPFGRAATFRGRPAWRPGPLAKGVERRFRAERCPSP